MIAKMGIVKEEADKTLDWLESLVQSGTTDSERVAYLASESESILRLTVASLHTFWATESRKPKT